MMGVNRATVAASVILAFAASTALARDLRSTDIQPPGSPAVEAVEYVGKLVRERTDGRHSIEVGRADRDSENFSIASVRNGTLDMARVNLEVLNSLVPATVVPSLPYLFKSTSHMRGVLDGPIGEEILANMSGAGIVGLCFYDMGAHSFYSAEKAIRHIEDMRGLTVRVQQGGVTAAMVHALGARSIVMPGDRVLAAFRARAIDAAEDNLTTYVASGRYKVARHYSLTGHSLTPGVLLFSKIVWEQLTPVDRSIIRAAAKESVSRMRSGFDAYELTARHRAEQEGVEMIDDVDRKSFARVLTLLYPELARDPKAMDMVRRIQADDEVAHKP
jgi:tripartite ATP-independent transporter DctP family solute receptor